MYSHDGCPVVWYTTYLRHIEIPDLGRRYRIYFQIPKSYFVFRRRNLEICLVGVCWVESRILSSTLFLQPPLLLIITCPEGVVIVVVVVVRFGSVGNESIKSIRGEGSESRCSDL